MKPHPACSLKSIDYPSLDLYVTNSSLADLLSDCDAVFAGHITSAVVDAYVAGIPVVSMLDGKMFNMSPLRNLDRVVFVDNPYELAGALSKIGETEGSEAKPYFHLDRKLNRWRRLLDLSECVNLQNCQKQKMGSKNQFGVKYERDIQQRI